ncbi:MAG: hypothetical protein LBG74_06565 [Spirochaetaceae bacterium]|jgi:hypothetical protein|nr:hypothetical protein [Spirochaetaceae bacterium]
MKYRLTVLTMALVACMVFMGCNGLLFPETAKNGNEQDAEEDNEPKFDEFGRPLVPLSISLTGDLIVDPVSGQRTTVNISDRSALANDGPSRALFTNLAKTMDFVEVVFRSKDATPIYYTKSARLPNPLNISVPVETYVAPVATLSASTAYATLLGGSINNGTPILLAMGKITTPTGGTITATTAEIVFTMDALKMDLRKTGGASATSDYTITTPDIKRQMTTDSTPVSKLLNIDDKYVPWWQIPFGSNVSSSKVTITVANSNQFGVKGIGTWGTAAGVKSQISFQSKTLSDPTKGPPVIGALNFITGTPSVDAIVIDATGISIPLLYNIAASSATPTPSAGLALLSYDVPVMGLDIGSGTTRPSKGVIWHIRGGYDNAHPDGGATNDGSATNAPESLGGAIVLEIGNANLSSYVVTSTIP